MHPRFLPAFGYAAVVAAACASALINTKAYAESPTIDNTPFVSSRTRAEVRAELTPGAALGYGESSQQGSDMQRMASGYTRADAIAAYKASRVEASALTGEDSGSVYLSQHMPAQRPDMAVARAAR